MSERAEPRPTRSVLVPYDRLPGWVERFSARHGEPVVVREGTTVILTAPDGAAASYEDAPAPEDFGILLVRRGGYAIGRVEAGELTAHKTGTRYVQGRTKAGGWSQQRYARRRANQADGLVEAAAEVARRLLPDAGAVFGGGDRALVGQVVDGRERGRELLLAPRWIEVKEPRFAALETALRDAQAYEVHLNALA
ncbi:acVLRF1 family peptidyl-tRNA hydrolase [Mumia sp. DW29H23]|uniref:acVLRF1 family peptidyl-tRNA hydrolase n=1 Tax=Mumia sp. DW29H23 TaxID=3421241 RepID=UPI003D6998FB